MISFSFKTYMFVFRVGWIGENRLVGDQNTPRHAMRRVKVGEIVSGRIARVQYEMLTRELERLVLARA